MATRAESSAGSCRICQALPKRFATLGGELAWRQRPCGIRRLGVPSFCFKEKRRPPLQGVLACTLYPSLSGTPRLHRKERNRKARRQHRPLHPPRIHGTREIRPRPARLTPHTRAEGPPNLSGQVRAGAVREVRRPLDREPVLRPPAEARP